MAYIQWFLGVLYIMMAVAFMRLGGDSSSAIVLAICGAIGLPPVATRLHIPGWVIATAFVVGFFFMFAAYPSFKPNPPAGPF